MINFLWSIVGGLCLFFAALIAFGLIDDGSYPGAAVMISMGIYICRSLCYDLVSCCRPKRMDQ